MAYLKPQVSTPKYGMPAIPKANACEMPKYMLPHIELVSPKSKCLLANRSLAQSTVEGVHILPPQVPANVPLPANVLLAKRYGLLPP